MPGARANTAQAISSKRRQLVVDLVCQGKNTKQVAEILGVNQSTAWRELNRGLAELAERTLVDCEKIRSVMVNQIDALIDTYQPLALAGDVAALDRWLKLLTRKAQMLGVDAPTKQQIEVTDLTVNLVD
jgi:hypothetical protein